MHILSGRLRIDYRTRGIRLSDSLSPFKISLDGRCSYHLSILELVRPANCGLHQSFSLEVGRHNIQSLEALLLDSYWGFVYGGIRMDRLFHSGYTVGDFHLSRGRIDATSFYEILSYARVVAVHVGSNDREA